MQIINKNEPNPRPSSENTMKAKDYSEALGWVNPPQNPCKWSSILSENLTPPLNPRSQNCPAEEFLLETRHTSTTPSSNAASVIPDSNPKPLNFKIKETQIEGVSLLLPQSEVIEDYSIPGVKKITKGFDYQTLLPPYIGCKGVILPIIKKINECPKIILVESARSKTIFLYMVNDQTFDLLHCSPCPWGFHEYKHNFVLRFEGFVEFPVNTEDVFNFKPVKPDTDHSSTKSISESTSKESPKHNLPNKKEALNIAENNANKASCRIIRTCTGTIPHPNTIHCLLLRKECSPFDSKLNTEHMKRHQDYLDKLKILDSARRDYVTSLVQ